MLEEAGQTHAIVREMGFFANHYYVVFSPFHIVLEKFLTARSISTSLAILWPLQKAS
jgi:hypothetical protein